VWGGINRVEEPSRGKSCGKRKNIRRGKKERVKQKPAPRKGFRKRGRKERERVLEKVQYAKGDEEGENRRGLQKTFKGKRVGKKAEATSNQPPWEGAT